MGLNSFAGFTGGISNCSTASANADDNADDNVARIRRIEAGPVIGSGSPIALIRSRNARARSVSPCSTAAARSVLSFARCRCPAPRVSFCAPIASTMPLMWLTRSLSNRIS